MISTDKLTLGEIAAIEKYSGRRLGELSEENNLDIRTLTAFGYVISKRLGLQAELSDIEQLSVDEINQLLEQDLPSWTARSEKAEKIAEYLETHPIDTDAAGE